MCGLHSIRLILFVTASQGGIDEEISLKRKIFESERYDSEVLQFRWRKTVEGDLENIGKCSRHLDFSYF